MITKRLSLSVIVWMCVFVANPTQADLSFGPNVIVKGNTIEVVGPGPDLQSIIDGITDESASIIGSGEHATILKGAISTASQSGESAIIAAANPATLADLKVFNTGGSVVSIGIYNTNDSRRTRQSLYLKQFQRETPAYICTYRVNGNFRPFGGNHEESDNQLRQVRPLHKHR